MDTKGAIILGACLIVAALIVTLVPRPAPPPPSEVGRFQLVHRDGVNFILDTRTGVLRQEESAPARAETAGWKADDVRPLSWRAEQSWREVKPAKLPRPPGK